jgi:3-oxoacyl-[acyl-carrier protein] reductase
VGDTKPQSLQFHYLINRGPGSEPASQGWERDMDRLIDRVALITGGSSGIGLATGRLFASKGAHVVLVARRESPLKEAVDSIIHEGGRAAYYCGDIGSEEDVRAITDAIIGKHGTIDVLINNAGIGIPGAFEELPTDCFDRMMKTNVRGSYLCTKYALASMKREKRGHIIFISSGAGKNGIAHFSAYCASKFAIMGMAESLALEAKPFNIKVSVLCPGSTNTEFDHSMPTPHSEETRKTLIQPQDIAEILHQIVTLPDTCWIYEVTTRAFLKGRAR